MSFLGVGVQGALVDIPSHWLQLLALAWFWSFFIRLSSGKETCGVFLPIYIRVVSMWHAEKHFSGIKEIQIIMAFAMECFPSARFQAWAAVLEFYPALVALSFRSFVLVFLGSICWNWGCIWCIFWICDSDFDEKLGKISKGGRISKMILTGSAKFSSGGRSLKMVLTGSGNWNSSRFAGLESQEVRSDRRWMFGPPNCFPQPSDDASLFSQWQFSYIQLTALQFK